MDKRIAEWLASGDTGLSSKAIMLWLSASVKDKSWGAWTPSDPSDLARCLRLLERIPEWKDRMPDMAGAGGRWPALMEQWDQIVRVFIAEAGGKIPDRWDDWSAPQTYELMKATEAEDCYASGN